jgi:toxin ParE1/3/4
MKRLKVRFRPEATRDLSAIFLYVHELSRSYATARDFARRIRERCERIGDAPFGGRPRDDLEKGLRTVPFEKSAVIAYMVDADCVRITNIFYGGRNYEAIYRGLSFDDDTA